MILLILPIVTSGVLFICLIALKSYDIQSNKENRNQ